MVLRAKAPRRKAYIVDSAFVVRGYPIRKVGRLYDMQ